MERIPQSPPHIPTIITNEFRPFWSVMIPIYNGSEYLEDAIKSVLQQDAGADKMQIEVVDDCSTDADVAEIVERVGSGRVAYFRQPENVGSLRNFETCINRANGYHIHLLHCDDRVKKGFYAAMESLFDSFPQAAAAFCAHDKIDHKGTKKSTSRKEADEPCILENLLYILAERQPIQYVSITVKREVYEKLGSFCGVTYGEDWEMWARIAKNYPVAYTPLALAEYRLHSSNISFNSLVSSKNLHDMSYVIDKVTSYLPQGDQELLNRKARKNYMIYSLLEYERMYRNKSLAKIPYTHLLNSLRFCKDVSTRFMVMKLIAKIFYIRGKRILLGSN